MSNYSITDAIRCPSIPHMTTKCFEEDSFDILSTLSLLR
jgi:hypothetical protein